jgi:toxin-antitoxin system PIN domain toxin
VILADTNFWLALSLSKHLFHPAARDWFAARSVRTQILFCRPTQQSFLRLLTTDAATRPYGIPPMTNAGAWKLYEALSADRRVAWAPEPQAEDVERRWKGFAVRGTASPKLWMDAYLAAFATAGGHQLVTTDKAFGQFKGLDAIVLVTRSRA